MKVKIGQVLCTIAPSIEIFDKNELEDPKQLDEMLEYLRSIEDELPFEVIFDDGEGHIIDRFGNVR